MWSSFLGVFTCVADCPSAVTVSGAEAVHNNKMGTYVIVSAVVRGNRPVYSHNSFYIFYRASANSWLIGPDYDGSISGVRSADKATCPTSVHDWVVYTSNAWNTLFDITIYRGRLFAPPFVSSTHMACTCCVAPRRASLVAIGAAM